jgi:hypothetical protein
MHSSISTRTAIIAALALSCQFSADRSYAQDPQPLPVTKGVYRLPFADGTTVRFSNNHLNHPTTLNRVDITGAGSPTTIVSAAAGWIRVLVDNNDTWCPNACGSDNDCDGDGVTTNAENLAAQAMACGTPGLSTNCCERDFEENGGNCPGAGTCMNGPNNLVWMEHPNGEWTKYTHMLFGTIGQNNDNNGNPGAGRFVGEFIAAGTPLGIEGDAGFASGPHVHFEGAVPNFVALAPNNALDDPDSPQATVADWFTTTGFLRGDGTVEDVDNDGSDDVNRQNRIVVFCQVGFPNPGDTSTAGPCDDQCPTDTSQLLGTIPAGAVFYRQVTDTMGNPASDYTAAANSGVSIRAGERITLSPGFHAELNSYFSASIGACDSPGGVGE